MPPGWTVNGAFRPRGLLLDADGERGCAVSSGTAEPSKTIVFDAAGGASLEAAAPLVKDGGRLVSIVDTPTDALFGRKKVRHAFRFVYPSGAQLEQIAALVDAGKVVVPTVGVRGQAQTWVK